jgi:exopolysaccharide biosynthesis predicted pyruvyltransferase EpsI
VNNKGALGCFLSHVRVWERIAQSEAAFSLVLEDDVLCHDLDRLNNLLLPNDADLVFVNDRTQPDLPAKEGGGVNFVQFKDALPSLFRRQRAIGTDGYLLTPGGARKLLQRVAKDLYFSHIDLRMGAYALRIGDLDAFAGEGLERELLSIVELVDRNEPISCYVGWPSLTTHLVAGSARIREDALVAAERKGSQEMTRIAETYNPPADASEVLRSDVSEYLEQFSGQDVFFFPNPGNGGDSLIACGTYSAFDRARVVEHQIGIEENQAGLTVFIGGGGNLVPMYKETRNAIERLSPKAKKLIILPHTIRGNEDLLSGLGRNATIFCRDHESYKWVRALNVNCEVLRGHDMAFHIDVDKILSDKALQTGTIETWRFLLSKKGYDEQSISRLGHMNLMRLDCESAVVSPHSDLDLSDLFSFGVSRHYAFSATWSMLRTLSLLERVATDRLHVAIACALLNIPCRLCDNSYGKNESVYKTSIEGRFPNLQFEPDRSRAI